MLKELSIGQLKEMGNRFRKTISVFSEQDADFRPREDFFGVAYTIAHAGESISWMVGGVFSADGVDVDIERHLKRVAKQDTLAKALAHFDNCLAESIAVLEDKSDEQLLEKLPEGPVLSGKPRLAVIELVIDHTASHRGALGVYARMLGKKPPMPYV